MCEFTRKTANTRHHRLGRAEFAQANELKVACVVGKTLAALVSGCAIIAIAVTIAALTTRGVAVI
jgi:hypothetical protein